MDILAFENVINKIDGVINSKVICDGDNIIELHVLANYSRAPKQIVRDIESSLIASFNYRIDRRVISIAQIHTEDTKKIRRVKLSGVTLSTSGNDLDCTVKLVVDDDEYSHTLSAVKTSSNRRRIVAESTIKALERIIGKDSVFDVQDVLLHNARDVNFAAVVVNIVADEKEETLIGTALVKNDVSEAIARASLDALNRKLEKAGN